MKPIFTAIIAYIYVVISKPKSVCLTLLFCIIIWNDEAHSTSIVAIRTPNEVIIGADSFLGNENKSEVGAICKIRQTKNIFFAVSGIPIAKGDNLDFNVYEIATEVFSRTDPIEERIDTYDSIIKHNIKKIVNLARRDKKIYESYFRQDKAVIDIYIAMMADTFPVMYRIYHTVTSSINEPVKVSTVIERGTEKLDSEITINWDLEDRQICLGLMSGFNVANAVTTVQKCIELASQKRPTVKLPIDILKITRNGAEWVQHKPECPDIISKPVHHK